jgi:hypothetical protein
VLGKRSQAHRLGRVARSDYPDRLRASSRAQDLPARHQRPEDRFRRRRANAHQPAELGLLDDQHATRSLHPSGHEAALPRQQAQLADEPAAPVRREDHLLGAVLRDDLDLAVEHHEELVGRLTRREQQLPVRDRTLDAKRRHV